MRFWWKLKLQLVSGLWMVMVGNRVRKSKR